jgi:hypothetical protein
VLPAAAAGAGADERGRPPVLQGVDGGAPDGVRGAARSGGGGGGEGGLMLHRRHHSGAGATVFFLPPVHGISEESGYAGTPCAGQLPIAGARCRSSFLFAFLAFLFVEEEGHVSTCRCGGSGNSIPRSADLKLSASPQVQRMQRKLSWNI